ncbi:hypothetical protein AAZX31_20G038300 [Glycine max]
MLLQQILPPTLHTHVVVSDQSSVPIEDLNHGVVDMVLEAKEEVEVMETNIGINGDDREVNASEGEVDVGMSGGSAYATLAGGDDSDMGGGAEKLRLAVPLEDGEVFGFGFFKG